MKISRICGNDDAVTTDESGKPVVGPCQQIATTWRVESRWGGDGEPVFVKHRLYVCADCAHSIDEGRLEARWEARVS